MTSKGSTLIRLAAGTAVILAFGLQSFATPTAEQKKPAGAMHTKMAAAKSEKTMLPEAASVAFKKNYPGAMIRSVRTEMSGTAKMYHVIAMEGKHERHLIMAEDGTVSSDREHLALADAPKAVLEAARKSMADAKIDRVAKVYSGASFTYGVTVQTKSGMKELFFDEQGNPVTK